MGQLIGLIPLKLKKHFLLEGKFDLFLLINFFFPCNSNFKFDNEIEKLNMLTLQKKLKIKNFFGMDQEQQILSEY